MWFSFTAIIAELGLLTAAVIAAFSTKAMLQEDNYWHCIILLMSVTCNGHSAKYRFYVDATNELGDYLWIIIT